MVCIHGGGFRAGTRQSYLPIAYYLAQHGYVAATVTYRLSPMAQFPAPVEDVKAAVRFLRANAARFHVDPDRIGTVGGSAGAHLALMLGVTGGVAEFEGSGPNLDRSSRVQAVVNFYGPTDFTKSYEPGKSVDAAEVLPMFLGGDLEHNRPEHVRASPLYWVSPDDAPTLTVHGTKDNYVAYEQAVWLTERLEAAGVPTNSKRSKAPATVFKAPISSTPTTAMVAWFDQYLAPPETQRLLVVADHGPRGEIVALDWPSGRERWTLPNNRGHDVQLLPNGHVLYTTGDWRRVVEVDPRKRSAQPRCSGGREVWSYGLAEGLKHPVAAQRLANGNTVIGDMELGKVIEVDPAGKTVWEYENPEMAEHRMRSVRRTDEGTTLISVERLNKVIEVDPGGKYLDLPRHRRRRALSLPGASARQRQHADRHGRAGRGRRSGARRQDRALGRRTQRRGADGLVLGARAAAGRRLSGFRLHRPAAARIRSDWKIVHELRLGSRTVASVSMIP